jgi:multicomponent Na+:H+ antiporter subunit E
VVLLAASWWALNPRDSDSWVLGVPVVVATAWVAARLAASARWSLRLSGLLRFAPFFLLASLRGGADVTWRALHPRLPIEPALVRHPLRLPEGTARIFLIDVMCLLPGSLSADCRGATLLLHVLNDTRGAAKSIGMLEDRVAALFGVELPDESGATR